MSFSSNEWDVDNLPHYQVVPETILVHQIDLGQYLHSAELTVGQVIKGQIVSGSSWL